MIIYYTLIISVQLAVVHCGIEGEKVGIILEGFEQTHYSKDIRHTVSNHPSDPIQPLWTPEQQQSSSTVWYHYSLHKEALTLVLLYLLDAMRWLFLRCQMVECYFLQIPLLISLVISQLFINRVLIKQILVVFPLACKPQTSPGATTICGQHRELQETVRQEKVAGKSLHTVVPSIKMYTYCIAELKIRSFI